MSVFLDGLILLILVLFVISGVRKGLIRSAVNFFGTLLSAYFSAILAKVFALSIYDSFIRQSVINSVSDSLESTVGQGAITSVSKIADNLPGFLKAIMPGIENSAQLQNVLYEGIDSVSAVVEQLVCPIITGILSVALTVVLFALFSVLVRFISRSITRVCRVPVLLGVNRTLGGVLGMLMGVVIVMLAVSLLSLSEEFTTSYRQTIGNTVLFRLFYNYNLFGFLFH